MIHRGCSVDRIQDADTFCRLVVRRGADELLVDLAVDAPPGRPPSVTFIGPTLDRVELAGRKLLALFDRAEARDFVDVYLLAAQFSTRELLANAAETDPGFDRAIFADMLRTLSRFVDEDLPLPANRVPALKNFFAEWQWELRGQ